MKQIIFGGIYAMFVIKSASVATQILNLILFNFGIFKNVVFVVSDIVIYITMLILFFRFNFMKKVSTIKSSSLIILMMVVFITNILVSNFNQFYMSYMSLPIDFLSEYYSYNRLLFIGFEWVLLLMLSIKFHKLNVTKE